MVINYFEEVSTLSAILWTYIYKTNVVPKNSILRRRQQFKELRRGPEFLDAVKIEYDLANRDSASKILIPRSSGFCDSKSVSGIF